MPDNEEIQGVKFSEFPSATPGDSDEVVGLHSGDNARFSVANFVLAIRQGLANIFVPLTREINNKALSSDITLDASDVGAVDASDVGVADGVASLDSNGKVPSSQLPTISSDAVDITYDPTSSGASATNVQDALDEAFDDLDGKQDEITASGILKGDGQGGVSAATAGTDYQAPLTIDATPTENSTNPVQSGGVYTDVRTRVPVYGLGKNLLDNAYFLNPVNQRGATSGTVPNNQYTIDRWRMSYGTAAGTWSLASAGLALTPGTNGDIRLIQVPQSWGSMTGKATTLSVLTSDGVLRYGTAIKPSSGVVAYFSEGGIIGNCVASDIRIQTTVSCTIVAAKLELGSEQTLCHNEGTAETPVWVLNEIPDYGEELRKCQRYYWQSKPLVGNETYSTVGGVGYCDTTTTASIPLPLPVPLARGRAAVLTYGNLSVMRIYKPDGFVGVTNLEIAAASSDTSILRITATLATAQTVGTVVAGISVMNNWIAVSVEP